MSRWSSAAIKTFPRWPRKFALSQTSRPVGSRWRRPIRSVRPSRAGAVSTKPIGFALIARPTTRASTPATIARNRLLPPLPGDRLRRRTLLLHNRQFIAALGGTPWRRSGAPNMATYEYPENLVKVVHPAFNADHRPGEVPPFSGIYRCMGCGREIVAEQARQFPPQNHHQHTTAQGHIRWRLIVYADHQEKK